MTCLFFCLCQFGTMTTTCALLMLCTMTTLLSTQQRQRKECLRSSIIFTVSLRSVTPQQSVLAPCGRALFVELMDLRLKQPILFAGRTPEVTVTLQQKFRQFSLETGILADNIVIFPQNGMSLNKLKHFNRNAFNCFWKWFRPLCSLASTCVLSQVSVLRREESPAIRHPLLSEVPGFHLRRLLFSPLTVIFPASQSCTRDNETKAFYSKPCCIPKTNPDPNSDLILFNSRINCGIRVEQQRAEWDSLLFVQACTFVTAGFLLGYYIFCWNKNNKYMFQFLMIHF